MNRPAAIAVTGAGGFIGRQVVHALRRRKHRVLAAVKERNPFDEMGDAEVLVRRVDLLDEAASRAWIRETSPDAVIHLAWFAVPGQYWTSPENSRWEVASVALMREAVRAGARKFVGAGTCAEYDWSSGTCSESKTGLTPSTPYGRAKLRTFLALQELWGTSGVHGAWARIFFPFGPGEAPERLVPSMIRALAEGRPVRCSEGRQVRDFLYVKDVAEAIVALLESEVSGPVNIASGIPLSVRELVMAIVKQMGLDVAPDFGALPMRPDDPPEIVADVGRLFREVGWRPECTLEQGLQETISWWKREL